MHRARHVWYVDAAFLCRSFMDLLLLFTLKNSKESHDGAQLVIKANSHLCSHIHTHHVASLSMQPTVFHRTQEYLEPIRFGCIKNEDDARPEIHLLDARHVKDIYSDKPVFLKMSGKTHSSTQTQHQGLPACPIQPLFALYILWFSQTQTTA